MLKNNLIIAIIFFVIHSGLSFAKTEDGGTEGPFALGVGARALGMGRAFVAVADDATSLYWNPAGLIQLTNKEITALHTDLFMGTDYQFIGFAYPTEKVGSFGFGIIRINTNDIIQKDLYDNYTGNLLYEEKEIILSYGRHLPHFIQLPIYGLPIYSGISMKMDTQQIGNYSDSGIGLDFGLLCSVRHNFSFGANLQNLISSKIRLKDETDTKPFNIKFGIKRNYRCWHDRDNFTLTAEINKSLYRTLNLRFGVEYWYRKLLAARFGLDGGKLTCGVGISYDGTQFDYALATHELSNVHRFSLTVRFTTTKKKEVTVGVSEDERQRLISEMRDKMAEALNNYKKELSDAMAKEISEYRQESEHISTTAPVVVVSTEDTKQKVAEYLKEANKYYQADKLIDATEKLNLAIYLDPTNSEAQELLTKTNKKLAVMAHLAQGITFFEEEDWVASMTEFEAILKLEPEHDVAKKYYKKIRSMVTSDKMPTEKISELYYKGINYYVEGQLEQAITVWEEIIKIDPYNKNAIKNIEKAKERLKKLQKK